MPTPNLNKLTTTTDPRPPIPSTRTACFYIIYWSQSSILTCLSKGPSRYFLSRFYRSFICIIYARSIFIIIVYYNNKSFSGHCVPPICLEGVLWLQSIAYFFSSWFEGLHCLFECLSLWKYEFSSVIYGLHCWKDLLEIWGWDCFLGEWRWIKNMFQSISMLKN